MILHFQVGPIPYGFINPPQAPFFGPQLQGAPLVNSNGEVVGVASRAYAPLGFAPDAVWFSPLIKSACEKVLQCP